MPSQKRRHHVDAAPTHVVPVNHPGGRWVVHPHGWRMASPEKSLQLDDDDDDDDDDRDDGDDDDDDADDSPDNL